MLYDEPPAAGQPAIAGMPDTEQASDACRSPEDELLFCRRQEDLNVRYEYCSTPRKRRNRAAGLKKNVLPDVSADSDQKLVAASVTGNLDEINELIAAGANANAISDSSKGWTALMYAAENDDPRVVQALIDAGADVNAKNDAGGTALMRSIVCENSDVAAALINSGASVNEKNNEGQTALMIAIIVENLDVVKVLIAAGADVNAKDAEGENVLRYAMKSCSPEIINTIIAAGGQE